MEIYVDRFKASDLIPIYCKISPFTQGMGPALWDTKALHRIVPSACLQSVLNDFKSIRHDLLDFYSNRFDRDYVEFAVRVADLESSMIPHINQVRSSSVKSVECVV